MLGIVKAETKLIGVEPMVSKMYFTILNTDKKKEQKVVLAYDSDLFVGYTYADIELVFKITNEFFEGIFNIFKRDVITSISNRQYLLVNSRMDSTLHIETLSGMNATMNISNLFERFVKDTDFYVLANDLILNICGELTEVLENGRKKNGKS